MSMIYSMSSTSGRLSKHKSDSDYGPFSLLLNITDLTVSTTTRAYKTHKYIIHGWFEWVAWGFLGAIQVFSGRYLRAFWKVNMWIHIISGLLTIALNIAFSYWLLYLSGYKVTGVAHRVIGVIFLPFSFVLGVQGMVIRYLWNRLKWRTTWLLNLRASH